MSNVKISQLPEYTGNTTGVYLVMNNSGETTTYKVKKETLSAGTSGTSGTSGSAGTSGTSGTSGSAGTSGTSGTSGATGSSGTSGSSGISGTSGDSIFAQTGSFWNTTKNVGITGSFNVKGNTTITGSLIVSASASPNTINTIQALTANNIIASGVAGANYYQAPVNYISSSAYTRIEGPVTSITGSLIASGSSHKIVGGTSITGSLIASGSSHKIVGDTSITGALNVTNNISGSGLYSNSGLNVDTGNTNINSYLLNITSSFGFFSGTSLNINTAITDGVNITGSLRVSGSVGSQTTVKSTDIFLSGSQIIDLKSANVNITGSVNMTSNLTSSGSATFGHKSSTSTDLLLFSSQSATLNTRNVDPGGGINNQLTIETQRLSTRITDYNTWAGSLDPKAILKIDANIVSGSTPIPQMERGLGITGSLIVSSTSNLNGNTSITGSLRVSNNSTITGSLTVSGSNTITGSVNVTNKLNLTPQNPLPSGVVGDLAVSSSNRLYFHNGTSWNLIS